jgi:hypothetical protein
MTFGRLIAIFAGIIAFILILVVIFGRGKPAPTGPTIQPLPDYSSTDATVSFTTDGIVNADQLHRQIRITISNTTSTVDVLQGYNGQVIMSKSFVNNQEAYLVFLKSLNYSGFLAKNKKKISSDERGFCPLGFRYVFDLNGDEGDLSRLWTSSCAIGNWGGNLATVQALFQNQIPDYAILVQDVNLQATTTSTTSL